MGLLECASENLLKAEELFKQAIEIRILAGDSASSLLASSYLYLSRVYLNMKEYKLALSTLGNAEVLYLKISGPDAPFMAQ